jgi:N-acetylglucosamine-6-sulfatase
MSDDQRFDFMGCAGHPYLQTPAMDSLARDGIRFTNAFTPIPLCAPARASHLSGLYPHRHGVIHNFRPMNPDVLTWPEALRAAGYRTGLVGKIHFGGGAPHPGFEHWVSFEDQGQYLDPVLNINGDQIAHRGYNTDILADYACRFLERDDGRPWALCLWYKAPHGPFTPPPRYRDLYAGEPLPLPATMGASLEGKTRAMREGEPAGHRRDWGPDDVFAGGRTYEAVMRDYPRTLKAVDDALGAVLDRIGRDEDTLVIHTSDHGYFLGEFGLADKRWMYDPSIRIPLLIRYGAAGQAAGRTESALVLGLDLAATIADFAGVLMPDLQGHSLRPLLTGQGEHARTSVFIEYFEDPPYPALPTMVCARTATAKLVHHLRDGERDELYDLAADPDERHNLAGSARAAALEGEMRRILADSEHRCGFAVPEQ